MQLQRRYSHRSSRSPLCCSAVLYKKSSWSQGFTVKRRHTVSLQRRTQSLDIPIFYKEISALTRPHGHTIPYWISKTTTKQTITSLFESYALIQSAIDIRHLGLVCYVESIIAWVSRLCPRGIFDRVIRSFKVVSSCNLHDGIRFGCRFRLVKRS